MSLISAFFVWWEGVLILRQWFGERYREGHLGKTIQRLQRGHASLSHPDHPEGAPCLLHHRWLVLMTLSILLVHQVGNQGELLPWGEWAIGKQIWMTKTEFLWQGMGGETRSRDGCDFIFWLGRHREEFPLLTHLSFFLPEFCIPRPGKLTVEISANRFREITHSYHPSRVSLQSAADVQTERVGTAN